jgi:hypothetical protein
MRANGVATPTSRYPWRIFWVLFVGAIFGAVSAYPYILGAFGKTLRDSGKLSVGIPLFIAMQLMNLSLIFSMAVGLGLLMARKVDLRMPFLRAWLYHEPIKERPGFWRSSVVAGVIVGAVAVAVLDYYILPRVPAWPSETALPFWQRALAAIYAGVNEELLMRLFVFALILWLVQKIAGRSVRSSTALFWTANFFGALALSALYLPTTAAIVQLTPEVVLSVMGFNSIASLVFGYLCWYRGIESAMLAHFICDLVMHSVGPLFAPR